MSGSAAYSSVCIRVRLASHHCEQCLGCLVKSNDELVMGQCLLGCYIFLNIYMMNFFYDIFVRFCESYSLCFHAYFFHLVARLFMICYM